MACDGCLRRARLIGLLAPQVAGLLDRPGARTKGLLALDDADLVAAVAGEGRGEVERRLDGFDAGAERASLHELGVGAVCRHDDGFPARLVDLHDAPSALFFRGGLPALDKAVAVVGARAASPYGLEVAYELGRGLGAAG